MSGDVVDDLRRVRQELAHPRPVLPVLREPERRLRHRQQRLPHRLGDALALADRVGDLRALVLGELRLVVERLELRRPAGLVQEDDALGLRREVRKAGETAGLRIARVLHVAPAASNSGESSDPSAAAPMPRAVRPNSCRRVR